VDGQNCLYHAYEVRECRISVCSVLLRQPLFWDAEHHAGRLSMEDMTQAARRAVSSLRRDGCDLVIALAHTGLGEQVEAYGQENALWPLTSIEGIDAVVAGHTHLHLPDPKSPRGSDLSRGILNGTPVVMPGSGGDHLGVIDITLTHGPTGWRVIESAAQLRPVKTKEDNAMAVMTAQIHSATRRHLSKSVGHTRVPLHSYFSFLAPSAALSLVASAQAHAVRVSGSVPDGLPLLSSVAPARVGGHGGPSNYVDIPAGPLTRRHVFDLCYFPNRLSAVVITGAQLRDWIEMSAGIYTHLRHDAPDQPFLVPDRPSFGSDVIYGVTYELDLSSPARFDALGHLIDPRHNRVVDLHFDRTPVASNDRFVVAVSSYRANGGGHVRTLEDADVLNVRPDLVRDVLEDFVGKRSNCTQCYEPTFRFSDLGGRRARAVTGPGAEPFLHELGHLGLQTWGRDKDGFLSLHIKL